MSEYLQWTIRRCEWLRSRVEKGATLLDRVAPPQWRDRIDPYALNIMNSRCCVLGQVFGHYNTGRDLLMSKVPVEEGVDPFDNWPTASESHGFLCLREHDLEVLHNEWRLQIARTGG